MCLAYMVLRHLLKFISMSILKHLCTFRKDKIIESLLTKIFIYIWQIKCENLDSWNYYSAVNTLFMPYQIMFVFSDLSRKLRKWFFLDSKQQSGVCLKRNNVSNWGYLKKYSRPFMQWLAMQCFKTV